MRRFFPFSTERTHSTSMTVTNSDCNMFRFSTQTTSSGCANRFLNSVLTISFSWAPIYPNDTKHFVQFKEYLNNLKNFTLKSYIYVPWTRLLKLRLKGIRLDPSIVTTRHLPRTEYLDMLSQSKVVVDVSNRFQTGLAMRVIEALAMHKKILTDNPHITREPFFQSGNICLFDAAHPSFPPDGSTGRSIDRSHCFLSENGSIGYGPTEPISRPAFTLQTLMKVNPLACCECIFDFHRHCYRSDSRGISCGNGRDTAYRPYEPFSLPFCLSFCATR